MVVITAALRRVLLFSVLCLIVSGNVFPQQFSGGQVYLFHIWEGIPGLLVGVQNMVNPDNCTRTDLYILRQAHPMYKEFYALVLAAHIGKTPLQFSVSGCVNGFPSIQHVKSLN